MSSVNLFGEETRPKIRKVKSAITANPVAPPDDSDVAEPDSAGDHIAVAIEAAPEKSASAQATHGPEVHAPALGHDMLGVEAVSDRSRAGDDSATGVTNELEDGPPPIITHAVASNPERAEVGVPFTVPYASLTVADDNPWGSDVTDDEAFRRVLAVASVPADLAPMLVVRCDNGWGIVGDPAALIAVARLHENNPHLAAIEIPVREVTGSEAAIVLHTAREALGGRPFKNMRRARLALKIRETEGLNGKAVAAQLCLNGSGVTRDLQAARMEREHPVFARILTSPSDAPVSYYTGLRAHADMQASPDKAMTALVAAAGKLVKTGKTFTATEAKAALGVKKTSARSASSGSATTLKTSGYLESAVLERTTKGTARLIVSLPADSLADDKRVALLETWLAAAAPLFGNAS